MLVEQSRDGIVILDNDGKVYETNRRFAEMLGYSLEEVYKLSVWDWEYQYPHDQVLEMIRTVDEHGDHFETRHRRKDGSIYDVEISTNGAVFAGQKLIFCVCRDITERKQMEKQLRLLSSITQQVSDATVVFGFDGKIIYMNKAAQDLFGYRPEEILGENMDSLNAESLPEKEVTEILQMANSGQTWVGITKKRRRDGSTFLSECHISLYNDQGQITAYIDVLRDVTRRLRAEEALRFSDATFKSIHESVVAIDTEGTITLWNDISAQATYGSMSTYRIS